MRAINSIFFVMYVLVFVACFIAAFFYNATHQYLIMVLAFCCAVGVYLDRNNY